MKWFKDTRHILFSLLAVLLVLMPILSLDAGISGDEEVHLKQAEFVIKYYASFGQDKAALNTPVTNLKYYGQSFDNLTTLWAQLLGIEDIYTFRHICNSLVGWLCILFAALIAVHLSGYRAAIFTVLLLAASPRFIGHSLNNLKDIPFALGYVASIFFTMKVISDLKNIKLKYAVGLILSMALTLSIRPGGLLVFCYFVLFAAIAYFIGIKSENNDKPRFLIFLLTFVLIVVSSYFIGLLFWPYALENPIINPIISMKMMSDYPVRLRQLFEGVVFWSDQLPWYYLIKYVTITIPIVILPLTLIYVICIFNKKQSPIPFLKKILLLFVIIFPFGFTIVADSNVYGAWRHLLFTYPPLVIVAAIGLSNIMIPIKMKIVKNGIIIVFMLTLLPSTSFIIRNHPLEYTYFNKLAGDYNNVANNYELDYYYHSVREASLWLKNHIEKNDANKVKIASNYGISDYFKKSDKAISFAYTPYYSRGNTDWDYGIFYRTTIAPSQTSQKLWPPTGTLKCINTEGIAVCVIVKRQTHDDYLGKLAYENEDYTQAVSYLSMATQIDPGNEIAWINLGKSYLKLSKYNKAKEAFSQCLNMIPDYEPSMYYLAQIEILTGKPEKAENFYKQILKNNSKSYKTYLAYAQLKESLNEKLNAIELLDQCLKLNPNYKLAIDMKKEIKNEITETN
ncbi:tetratricopeptide repeat protein [Saccharicrinis sp. GN24d3]|uniref:tetratricopeptide repeat protein n=1 Tax=Saccharicrinis sp. GN24d3 TaxID=3458416 RepID=UPI0040351FA2